MRAFLLLVALAHSHPSRTAFDHVVALGDSIVANDCPPTVMGKPFRGARMLCLAAMTMALASIALDDPARADSIGNQIEALVLRAEQSTSPFDPRRSILYRGLLGVMLAAQHRVGSPAAHWTARFDEIAASVARDVERGWVMSYRDGIWPCDHAPAASMLRLHGVLRGSEASKRAADVLGERLRTLLAPGFPTKIDANGRVIDATVRGTTLAFTAMYLLPGEPELARAFAEELVATKCDRAPMAACKEGITKPDAASGPIIGEYSVGATALAIVATRALADRDWNAALLQTAALGHDRVAPRSLEAALLAWGETARAF